MKHIVAVLIFVLAFASADADASHIDLSGAWEGSWDGGGGGGLVYLELEQEDHQVTGTIVLYGARTFSPNPKKLEGIVDGDTFVFSSEGSMCTINASLSFKAGKKHDTLSGTFSCTMSGISMTLYRKKR